jgi:hypothetical protein
MSSIRQCAPDACGKGNRHALATALWLAADVIDGLATATRRKRMRERGLTLENDFEVENRLPDDEVGNNLEDVLAPAKNLLSLLEEKKRQVRLPDSLGRLDRRGLSRANAARGMCGFSLKSTRRCTTRGLRCVVVRTA